MVTPICLVTSTRAEYGVLKPLIECLAANNRFSLKLLVMGSHLSPEHGNTIQLIRNDGFVVDEQIEMLMSSDTNVGSVKSAGLAMIGLADCLQRLHPEYIILAGDRYETLAAAFSSSLLGISIVHLHGGEVTIGSQDDDFRHAISKLADYHFVSADIHKKRLVNMGENKNAIFVVGSLSADTIIQTSLLDLDGLEEILKFKVSSQFVLVAFHPVTSAKDLGATELDELMKALATHETLQLIFSTPNADQGSKMVLQKIERFCSNHKNSMVLQSRGQAVFLSLLHNASCIIGNSSSGITEAPILNTPTINVGVRQKGREAVDPLCMLRKRKELALH